ncbi:MAG: hypothetical protein CMN93_00235 [Synechococcus sp. CPC35]|nr:hypothetical protein [Synechococcus sp. CPC35]
MNYIDDIERVIDLDHLYKMRGSFDNHTFDGFCLTIDDFYENAQDLYEHLINRQYPLWKYNSESNTRNGIDYFDCRIVDKVGHPTRLYENDQQRLLDLCRRYFWKGHYNWSRLYEFNCFKTAEVFNETMQHYPHIDSALNTPDHLSTLNMLVYMDKQEDGGTAIYDGEWITNDENMALLYPVEERFNIRQVIPAKFNRCVIFPGNCMHGAYIQDYHRYLEDWRFTQVTFYHPQGDNHGN